MRSVSLMGRLALAAALISTSALAGKAPPSAAAPAKPEVIVLTPRVLGVPETEGAQLGSKLVEVAGQLTHVKALSVAEVRAGLSPETAKGLEGELEAISSAVSAAKKRFALGSQVSRMGSVTLLQLYLLDAKRAQVLARETAYVRGAASDLTPVLPSTLRGLLEVLAPEWEPGTPGQVTRRNVGFVNHCYEEQLRSEPGLTGKLIVALRVGKDGKTKEAVVDPKSTLTSEPVRTCVLSAASAWRFAPSRKEAVVKTAYALRPYDEPARAPAK